jgi:hypothetical protein
MYGLKQSVDNGLWNSWNGMFVAWFEGTVLGFILADCGGLQITTRTIAGLWAEVSILTLSPSPEPRKYKAGLERLNFDVRCAVFEIHLHIIGTHSHQKVVQVLELQRSGSVILKAATHPQVFTQVRLRSVDLHTPTFARVWVKLRTVRPSLSDWIKSSSSLPVTV